MTVIPTQPDSDTSVEDVSSLLSGALVPAHANDDSKLDKEKCIPIGDGKVKEWDAII